ncbi:MAG: hypothetical protein CVV39_01215 [Planctomycetes bacterium HGW-Planctomycetes-1]|nr:MAG: hypothetical protein CVV39_01215 [Planctomycetes bacterium HGW-Planctomycetes-1]
MDISLSQTIFAANVGTASNPLNLASAAQTQNSAEIAANANTGETGTTDNIPFIVQNKPADLLENFSSTLAKKMTVKLSSDDQADENTQEQNQTLAEIVIPQELFALPVVPDFAPDIEANKPLPQIAENQIPNNFVQPTADVEVIPSPVIQIAEPVQLAAEQKQIKFEIMMPDIPADEKPAPTNNPASIPLNTAEPAPLTEASTPVFNQQNNSEASPQTPTGGSKPEIAAEKSDAIDTPKTKTPNIQITDTEDKNQQNTAQITEKPAADKADIDTRAPRVKAESFDPLENNKFHIETISVKTVEQKISQPSTQSDNGEDEINDDLQPAQTANEPLAGNNVQSVVSEQSPDAAVSVKAAGNDKTAVSIRNQIQESIYTSFRSDSREIVVRLNPPELGKVAIKFSEQNNAITGLLQVDNLQTKNSIQQSLPEIIQNLNDGGVLIKKIEVVLTSQQEQYMPKEHSAAGQQNWAGNQSESNYESQRNNGFYGESFRYAESSADLMETQGLLTDNYINVLV